MVFSTPFQRTTTADRATDSSSVNSNKAALAAKQRFRKQYQQQKAQQRQRNSNDFDHDSFGREKERIAHAVGFSHSVDLCPKCSLPLLQQDLATIKKGGKRVVLCHSSSSVTSAKTMGNDAFSMGSSMENDTLHGVDNAVLDPIGENTHENSAKPLHPITGPNCGLALPMLSVLEEFAGTYCDSVCVDQVLACRGRGGFGEGHTSVHQQSRNDNVRQVPPYCSNCKAYVVRETGNEAKQDEMLTNLTSWLASTSSSSSSSDDGENDSGRKASTVSFRPSQGSITLILKNSEHQPQQSRGISGASSADDCSTRRKLQALHPQSPPRSPQFDISTIHGEPMEWDTLMQRRTPRAGVRSKHSFSSSPRARERYAIEEEELQEKKSHSSSSSIGKSPRRRRQYLDMLDHSTEDANAIQPTVSVPVKPPPVDPSPRLLPPQPKAQPVRIYSNDEVCEVSSPPVSPNPEEDSPRLTGYDIPHGSSLDERMRKLSIHTLPIFPTNESKKVEMQDVDSSTKIHKVTIVDQSNLVPPSPNRKTFEDDDNGSVGSCYTLKEEATIIKDYEKKREIATKAIGRKLMEGYILTQSQCDHCQMPMMESSGISECVVCPLVSKKAKKRADLRRKGEAIMETFDSESPPKRKQESFSIHAPSSLVESRDVEGESRGPFEEMKERAEEEINGLLIKWDEDAHDQEQQHVSPRSDDGSREAGGELTETIGNALSREEAYNRRDSDCSGSDVYDMEIGSQAVYQRLLSGWLLTNSNCPQCLAPLMQSTTGDVECVVCNNTDSDVSSPRHSSSCDRFIDAATNLLTNGGYRNEEGISEPETNYLNESAHVESMSPRTPLIHSDGKGLRYLALPDDLDMDDHEALLLFLANSQRKLNDHDVSTSAVVTHELTRDNVSRCGTEATGQRQHVLYVAHESTSSHGPRNSDDNGVASKLTLVAGPTANARASSTTGIMPQRQLQGNRSTTPPSTDSHAADFTSSAYARYQHGLQGDRLGSVPRMRNDFSSVTMSIGTQARSRHDFFIRDSDISSHASDVVVADPASHTSSREGKSEFMRQLKGEVPLVESCASSRADFPHGNELTPRATAFTSSRGNDFGLLSGNRASPVPVLSKSSTLALPFAHNSYSRYDHAVAEESPHSETGAIFDFNEDDDLILRFETAQSFTSDSVARRTRRQVSRGHPLVPLHNEQRASPDYVVHHAILKRNTSVDSRCHACKNALCSDVRSQDMACVNPHCTVYMIPIENIDIFTSAMKDTGDVRVLAERNAPAGALSQESPNDMYGWNMHGSHSRGTSGGSDRFRQLGDLDRQGWHGNLGSLVAFNEGIESRVSSVDSSNSISSNAANVLLSRMNEAKQKLVPNDTAAKERPETRSEMALLIDRLASAAVAIKDLEQSVQEAEENSPQRSLNGRPPTSPKSHFRGSDNNIRWF